MVTEPLEEVEDLECIANLEEVGASELPSVADGEVAFTVDSVGGDVDPHLRVPGPGAVDQASTAFSLVTEPFPFGEVRLAGGGRVAGLLVVLAFRLCGGRIEVVDDLDGLDEVGDLVDLKVRGLREPPLGGDEPPGEASVGNRPHEGVETPEDFGQRGGGDGGGQDGVHARSFPALPDSGVLGYTQTTCAAPLVPSLAGYR